MKFIIIQPKLEKDIKQLENELRNNPSVDAVIFPEGYLNENVEQACILAKSYNTTLIGGYRRLLDNPKDRAIIINRKGEIVLDRFKYSPTSFVVEEGLRIGHILCDELVVQGITSEEANDIDLIVHPIGVGMFSEDQFEEWINEAQKIAIKFKAMIIGTNHADGSFRDSDVSIPIAYCIDSNGEVVFISKNDVRPRILDIRNKEVIALQIANE
ncbi:hypothetical protein GK047_02515 [Paenibacillus sp. SYP-B3998]|uniref:CN hydrolase domain-containing protein n=1 Tax=Paenibacillus sp. SYP-B3998 TaxID=2678564 RepID=A0A6G3ZS58_9BACL|nr:hypothetical protein [Paenibacillus sp. SYP-B3998]NEW04890.1 hypothetical protein [Paenibacillus sp. SYP-B3998]